MSDEGRIKVTPQEEPGAAEKQRMAARRRFLKRGSAAGSGLVIYTISHQRSLAGGGGGTAQQVMVSSPVACQSIGGSNAKMTMVADSVNPVTQKNKLGQTVYDSKGNPVYEETKEAYQCDVVK